MARERVQFLTMGNSQSHQIFLALNALLRENGLKLKPSTLHRFLRNCDTIAPWYGVSGSLTIPSWDKLGRDLDFAFEQGNLEGGVRPIWKLVRACLEDEQCSEAILSGQAALEELQEERSERAASEKGKTLKESQKRTRKKLYPDLSELCSPSLVSSTSAESSSESSSESEECGDNKESGIKQVRELNRQMRISKNYSR